MNTERLAVLTAVKAGTVTGKHLNAPGSPIVFQPSTAQVVLGYLRRAGLIQVESHSADNRSRPVTVTVTDRGNRVLSGSTA